MSDETNREMKQENLTADEQTEAPVIDAKDAAREKATDLVRDETVQLAIALHYETKDAYKYLFDQGYTYGYDAAQNPAPLEGVREAVERLERLHAGFLAEAEQLDSIPKNDTGYIPRQNAEALRTVLAALAASAGSKPVETCCSHNREQHSEIIVPNKGKQLWCRYCSCKASLEQKFEDKPVDERLEAAGSNYTANDDTFPTEIHFANGRNVGIAFDGDKPYLTVGFDPHPPGELWEEHLQKIGDRAREGVRSISYSGSAESLETLQANPFMAASIVRGMAESRKDRHPLIATALGIVLRELEDLRASAAPQPAVDQVREAVEILSRYYDSGSYSCLDQKQLTALKTVLAAASAGSKPVEERLDLAEHAVDVLNGGDQRLAADVAYAYRQRFPKEG